MQNGAIRRKNMMTGESKSIKPKLPSDIKNELKYNFITPYLISYHNSNILYHAGNYVFKSYDRGDSWNVISGDLTNSSTPSKASFSAGAFAESKISQGLLYYGSDKGSFWVTKNDGKIWEEFSINIADA